MGRTRRKGPVYFSGFPIECGKGYISPYMDGNWQHVSTYNKYEAWAGLSSRIAEVITTDELHPGPPYKTGGPFNKWSYYQNQYDVQGVVDTISPDRRYRYVGGFLPVSSLSTSMLNQDWSNFETFQSSDYGNAYNHGATGWNKFRPTRPGVDLGQSIGEAKDIPRMLRTTAKGFHGLWRSMGGSATEFAPKRVADHWLNTQFGWLPFLSDLRGLYETTKNLDRRLKRLRRYNGKWEKRGGSFDTEQSKTVNYEVDNTIGLWPAASGVLDSTGGYYRRTTTISRRCWFVARFRYYIPGKPDSWHWKARAIAMLYGLAPSPSLLWELTPWSWLIDWWSNAGDCIANVSSSIIDNLAAKYAYVMRHSVGTLDYHGANRLLDGRLITGHWKIEYERKSRAAASPFGFGLSTGDFTARQWSILAALGLTRLR